MAYCAQHKLTVLVVDTFDRWTGLRGDAENAAGAVNAALEPLQYAAAAGLAVLLLSHQRKSSGEYGEAGEVPALSPAESTSSSSSSGRRGCSNSAAKRAS
jgi:hypothetical protein